MAQEMAAVNIKRDGKENMLRCPELNLDVRMVCVPVRAPATT